MANHFLLILFETTLLQNIIFNHPASSLRIQYNSLVSVFSEKFSGILPVISDSPCVSMRRRWRLRRRPQRWGGYTFTDRRAMRWRGSVPGGMGGAGDRFLVTRWPKGKSKRRERSNVGASSLKNGHSRSHAPWSVFLNANSTFIRKEIKTNIFFAPLVGN